MKTFDTFLKQQQIPHLNSKFQAQEKGNFYLNRDEIEREQRFHPVPTGN